MYDNREMAFNSLQYLLFLPIIIVLYFLSPKRFRNILLLLASYYFYIFSVPKYILLLILSTITTYFIGLFIEKNTSLVKKRRWLYAGVVLLISLLILFKYYNFFAGVVMTMLSFIGFKTPYIGVNILLPIGISFYLFQAISYLVDIYKNKIKAERNLIDYSLYLAFFPQVLAGPIARAGDLIPQFKKQYKFDYARVVNGLRTILIGLFKKIVIADTLSIYVNAVFDSLQLGNYHGGTLLLAVLLFTIQIYCDFSGYSDIAAGSAKVLGFGLAENFNTPYLSASISEFWSRWHISLSTWFRDYLYIPLGGNRKGFVRKCLNIMVVFILSGLWHGAGWTYVIWGALHGLYRVVEELWRKVVKRRIEYSHIFICTIHKIFNVVLTFILVSFAWIFFRANTLTDAAYVVNNMFKPEAVRQTFDNIHVILNSALFDAKSLRYFIMSTMVISVLFLIFSDLRDRHDVSGGVVHRQTNVFKGLSTLLRWSLYIAILVLIIIYWLIQNGLSVQSGQFIYFKF